MKSCRKSFYTQHPLCQLTCCPYWLTSSWLHVKETSWTFCSCPVHQTQLRWLAAGDGGDRWCWIDSAARRPRFPNQKLQNKMKTASKTPMRKTEGRLYVLSWNDNNQTSQLLRLIVDSFIFGVAESPGVNQPVCYTVSMRDGLTRCWFHSFN